MAALAAFTIAPGLAVAGIPGSKTEAATKVTATTAKLNGSVDPNGESTTYFFEYGTTTAYGTQTGTQPANTTGSDKVSADISGLTPSTTYNFRIVATNPSGTTMGSNMVFTTPATPPPSPGPGPGPGGTSVSISAKPTILVFGRGTTISGQVKGAKSAVRVELESNPHPFTGGFKKTGVTATSDSNGKYSLVVRPKKFTRYRVSVSAPSNATSAVVEVFVRYLVAFRVNDSVVRRGQLVKFSGYVKPAHNGRSVRIQRKIGTGAYKTIATTRLRSTTIAGRSVYSKRLRVRRTARYRIRITRDADHATGTSRSIGIRVS